MIERMAEQFSADMVYAYYPEQNRNENSLGGDSRRLIGLDYLRDALRKFEPDVVYSDSLLDSAYYHLSNLRKRSKPPLIQHLRGDFWREFWDWYGRAGWKNRAVGSKNFAYNWAGLFLSAKVTPICRWLDIIVRHYVPAKHTEVVYQGVDPAQFYEDEPFPFQKPAVAIIQNHTILSKVNGLIQFKNVIERLAQVNFYVAEGEAASQDLLTLVKSAFAHLSNVHFVSGVNSVDNVRRMLSGVDCYVLASGLDCCPTTVLEASLMSRPVLASRVGGVPEIIVEQRTGWTIQNTNIQEWVGKIKLVLSDTKLGREMGREGRQWVERNFSWQTIGKQVERLILNEYEGSNRV
jgi:glycosyltransferase involved in cell wall biosynthesis